MHDSERYEEFRRAVWERDYGIFVRNRTLTKKDEWRKVCQFYKCLTDDEKKLFLMTWKDSLYRCNVIDIAHLIPKSINPKEKYNPDNAACINTIAHGCLDTYRNPLTNEPMTRNDRNKWIDRIRIQVMRGR